MLVKIVKMEASEQGDFFGGGRRRADGRFAGQVEVRGAALQKSLRGILVFGLNKVSCSFLTLKPEHNIQTAGKTRVPSRKLVERPDPPSVYDKEGGWGVI
jgi:hypothetical protein